MTVYRGGGALRAGIEQAQAFQLVPEEIQSQPCFQSAGVDIDDGAAHGEFACIYHRVHAAVTLTPQQRGKALVPNLGPHLELAHGLADAEGRKDALQQRIDRGDDKLVALAARLQRMQRRQPPCADGQGRTGAVIRQAVPCRKFDHLKFRREELRRIGSGSHRCIVRRDENGAFLRSPCKVGHHQRLRTANNRC